MLTLITYILEPDGPREVSRKDCNGYTMCRIGHPEWSFYVVKEHDGKFLLKDLNLGLHGVIEILPSRCWYVEIPNKDGTELLQLFLWTDHNGLHCDKRTILHEIFYSSVCSALDKAKQPGNLESYMMLFFQDGFAGLLEGLTEDIGFMAGRTGKALPSCRFELEPGWRHGPT